MTKTFCAVPFLQMTVTLQPAPVTGRLRLVCLSTLFVGQHLSVGE